MEKVEVTIKVGDHAATILDLRKQKAEIVRKYDKELKAIERDIAQYEQEIEKILTDNNLNEIYDDSRGLHAVYGINISKTFNSKKVQKMRPNIYKECSPSKPRFDQKILKEKYPEIYEEFTEITETKTLKIEQQFREDYFEDEF